MDAVRECASALQAKPMTRERAIQCIELADALKGVENMAGLAKEAVRQLARTVGNVHELFTPAALDDPAAFCGLTLSDKVKVHIAYSVELGANCMFKIESL
jgi:hypothetical protein